VATTFRAVLRTALAADPTYPDLLRAGELFHHEDTPWPERLAFLARVVGAGPGAEAAAVRAAQEVRRLWPPEPSGQVVARLTTDSVASAVCVAVASGLFPDEVENVAELAAGLMVATPAGAELSGPQAGHALASAWLALVLHRSGVRAAEGTADEVLATRVAP
jgi:hypothetical protein